MVSPSCGFFSTCGFDMQLRDDDRPVGWDILRFIWGVVCGLLCFVLAIGELLIVERNGFDLPLPLPLMVFIVAVGNLYALWLWYLIRTHVRSVMTNVHRGIATFAGSLIGCGIGDVFFTFYVIPQVSSPLSTIQST